MKTTFRYIFLNSYSSCCTKLYILLYSHLCCPQLLSESHPAADHHCIERAVERVRASEGVQAADGAPIRAALAGPRHEHLSHCPFHSRHGPRRWAQTVPPVLIVLILVTEYFVQYTVNSYFDLCNLTLDMDVRARINLFVLTFFVLVLQASSSPRPQRASRPHGERAVAVARWRARRGRRRRRWPLAQCARRDGRSAARWVERCVRPEPGERYRRSRRCHCWWFGVGRRRSSRAAHCRRRFQRVRCVMAVSVVSWVDDWLSNEDLLMLCVCLDSFALMLFADFLFITSQSSLFPFMFCLLCP